MPVNSKSGPEESTENQRVPFDVFLAHNSSDKQSIRLLHDALAKEKIRPWVDADQIAPGQSFQDAIQKAIKNVGAIAICIGEEGLGKWQELELKVAISRCVDSGIPVVPVLLPGVDQLPDSLLFLRELNWVKFEKTTQEETPVLRLIWGILGTKPSKLSALETLNSSEAEVSKQPIPAGQPGRSKGVVFGLHGIRTDAAWHRKLYEVLGNYAWQVRTDRWYFGKYNIFQFLSPRSRTAKVDWFANTYSDEIKDRRVRLSERQFPSIVAHSFGTYILGNAMLKYDWLRFEKIVLCGSILPIDFPWDELLERGQVQAVRNEHGSNDIWVKAVRWFVADTAPSGNVGFKCKHEKFEQEEFYYRHSDYFSVGHIDKKWVPFLHSQITNFPATKISIQRPASTQPLGTYLATIMALVLAGGLLTTQLADSLKVSPSKNTPPMTPEALKPTAYFEVDPDPADLKLGVSELQFKFTNIPNNFYVDKVVLSVKDAGPSVPISKSPSIQVVPVKVTKIVSIDEIESSPSSISVNTKFAHDANEPIAILSVDLSYGELQAKRRLLVMPSFIGIDGSPISLLVKPSEQWIEIANYPQVLTTEE